MTGQLASTLFLSALSVTTFYLGFLFFKLKNNLLAAEMLFIGISAGCGVGSVALGSELANSLWEFFDVFSRLVGVTLIMAIGLLRVTHNYHLRLGQELSLFVGGMIIASGFISIDSLVNMQANAFVLTGLFFISILWYMAYCCAKRRLWVHCVHIAMASLAFITLSVINDFVELPSIEESPLFNELVLSQVLQIWGYSAIYITYKALMGNPAQHNSRSTQTNATQPALSER